MADPTAPLVDTAAPLGAGRRRWIDLLLIAAGLAFASSGWAAGRWAAAVWSVGVLVVMLGLVNPVLEYRARRHHGTGPAVSHLVPRELAAAYRDVVAAASLPGVQGAEEVVDAAEDALFEVASLLGGRPPRGAAQRRFVAARIAALSEAAGALREWHELWVEACAELSTAAEPIPPAESLERPPARPGVLVTVVVVFLVPVFLFWEAVLLIGRAELALLDGVALRTRTAGRLLVRGVVATAALAARVRGVWIDARRGSSPRPSRRGAGSLPGVPACACVMPLVRRGGHGSDGERRRARAAPARGAGLVAPVLISETPDGSLAWGANPRRGNLWSSYRSSSSIRAGSTR